MNTNLQAIIQGSEQIIEDRQYNDSYKGRIYSTWEKLETWMKENAITEFTEETGHAFCDDVLGGHLGNPEWNQGQREVLRSVRMLISFQKTGSFEFRSPRKEYQFYGPIGNMALEFLQYLETELNRHWKTLEGKRIYLEKLCIYMNTRSLALDDMDSRTILDLFESENFSNSSRKNAVYCYKEFLKFTFDKGYSKSDLSVFVPKIKFTKNKDIPTTYTEEEISRLVNIVDRASNIGKRDYLILLLAAQYGWRAGDICTFKFTDINWDENYIRFDQQKTDYTVEFPLLESVGNAIINYLKHARPDSEREEVILSNHKANYGEPLSPPTIHSVVSHYMKIANIKNWQSKKHGPHSLRHSLATNLLKKNQSLPLISTVLGHQSTEATRIYLSVDTDQLKYCCLTPPGIKSPEYKELEYE